MRAHFNALAVLSMMICGCSPIVIDPLESESQDGGSSVIQPDPEDAGPGALAMYMYQWNVPADPNPLFTPTPSLVVDSDPGDLVLAFSSEAQACAQPVIQFEPDPDACASEAFWQTILVLPADRAHPGLIDLDDPDIYVYRAAWMPECGGGSGNTPGIEGTLEIVSLDAASVSVKLALESQSGWPTGNGDYTASFCP